MLLNAQTSVHNTASTRFCMCAQIYTLTGRQLVIGLQTGLRLCTLFFSWNRRIHEKTRRAPLKEEARFQAQRQAAMLNRKLQNCILDANPKRKLRIINDNTNIWEMFTKKKAVALPPTRGRVEVI